MGDAYVLNETINGVTFNYRAPGEDPTAKPAIGGTFKDGDYEDLFFWVNVDDPADTFVIMDAQPQGADFVEVFTRDANQNWWKFKIDTGNQTWKRKNQNTGFGASRPVSQLRIKVNDQGEIEHPLTKVEVGGSQGEYGLVTHPGTTCTMVWNPATRRYVRVCN